jgi:NTE family protein
MEELVRVTTLTGSGDSDVMNGNNDLAVVMSGGGARGAYQVGFLHAVAKHHPELNIPIITGVSAGAINAAYLAANRMAFHDKVASLADIWSRVTTDQVFKIDSLTMARNVLGWGARLLTGGNGSRRFAARSIVDATPLCSMLERLLAPVNREMPGIAHNLARGALRAVALTASSYSTGQSVTWVQGRDQLNWQRGNRKIVRCKLKLDHILASASLPLFFPAVKIHQRWFGDGGIRMTAPLSPAIQLGASRILAIHTRCARSREEIEKPMIDHYPPPAQVVGALFNAIFLDVFDNDASRLERVNRLIERLPEEERCGMRPIKLLLIRPSMDLGKLASEHEAELPRTFRFMTRGMGTQETRSNDVLSLVMFQPDYLNALMDLGYRDAEAQMAEIDELLRADGDQHADVTRLGLTNVA